MAEYGKQEIKQDLLDIQVHQGMVEQIVKALSNIHFHLKKLDTLEEEMSNSPDTRDYIKKSYKSQLKKDFDFLEVPEHYNYLHTFGPFIRLYLELRKRYERDVLKIDSSMEEERSIFEDYESLPEPVKDILLSFDEEANNMYQECERIGQELLQHGYRSDYDLSGELTKLEKISCVKFIVTETLDSRKEGSDIKLNTEFVGELSQDRTKVYYTDKAGVDWIFWIGQTCKIV